MWDEAQNLQEDSSRLLNSLYLHSSSEQASRIQMNAKTPMNQVQHHCAPQLCDMLQKQQRALHPCLELWVGISP
jgi:hypothetical protein